MEACAATGLETVVYTFESDLEGFAYSGPATVSHTGSFGNPGLGAIEIVSTQNQSMRVFFNEPTQVDMSGLSLSLNIYVEPGATVAGHIYVQTNGFWSESYYPVLPTGVWVCMVLDMNNPTDPHAQFDPSSVEIYGLKLQASGGFHAYVDQFAY